MAFKGRQCPGRQCPASASFRGFMAEQQLRITLVGSRHFGVTTLEMLRRQGVDVVRVVVADAEDRLAAASRAADIEVVVQANPKLVVASEIADPTDLIVTPHS